MITVSFVLDGPRITGFTCAGHSGFAPAGEDVVCAAVTGLVRMTECAIRDVAGADADVSVSDADAAITLCLKAAQEEAVESACQVVLTAMMITLSQLSEEYPENITVLEV